MPLSLNSRAPLLLERLFRGSATINVTETLALVTFGAKASADNATITLDQAVSTSMTARPGNAT